MMINILYLNDFCLILREIIENEKGRYNLNKKQYGEGYIQEAFYEKVHFITITKNKLTGFLRNI